MNNLGRCLGVLGLTALAPLLLGGHDRGNGGDVFSPYDGVAWFIGDAPLVACVNVDAAFGVDANFAASTVERAYRAWIDYVSAKRVIRPEDSLKLPLSLSTRVSCRGDEDLTIYFGGSHERVSKAILELDLTDPIALAYRDSYDIATGRAQGAFIWLSMPDTRADDVGRWPVWSEGPYLYGVILHELGHVLGVPHVEGTIMSAALPQRVAFSRWLRRHGNVEGADRLMTSIDDTRELHICDLCAVERVGLVGFRMSDAAPAFRMLAGRDPVGDVVARLSRAAGPAAPWRLVVKDALGEVGAAIDLASAGSTYFGGGLNIFRRVGSTLNGMTPYESRETGGLVALGSVRGADGRKRQVLLERNALSMPDQIAFLRPIRLTYIEGAERRSLFEATDVSY